MASTNSPNTNPYVIDRRFRIRDVLSERDQELGDLYWAAIEILDPPTPARRRMSAHAIREMTNALPRVIDVPAKDTDQRLGDHVQGLIPLWNKARVGKCFVDGKWTGVIDELLERALIAIDEMIQWHQQYRPTRRAVAKGFLRKSDPSPLELPTNLQNVRATEWNVLHDFFASGAHRPNTAAEDFNVHLEQLENLLLSSLSREPFQDCSTIDAILAEEEQ